MNDALKLLEQQYNLLLNNFDDLIANCTSDEQKSALRTALVNARRNYWTAINETFHTDDPKVETAIKNLNAVEGQLETQVKVLGDIAKVIAVATSAVAAGGALVALAG